MKIAIIGPAHPYKGGIAQHTTELAHRLTTDGHSVEIVSWRHQYPFFYPGKQFVPDNAPEVPLFPATRRVLSWKNPIGWWLWGRRLRTYDQVIFVWWVPTIQGPVYRVMLAALRRKTPTTLLCHNVMPHETRGIDKIFMPLAKAAFKRVDSVLTHTDEQATEARLFTTAVIRTASLPAVLPAAPKRQTATANLKRQLLFFGIVRPYKGLDVLLKAAASVPDIGLTVAGEFWGDEDYRHLIKQLDIEQRVTIRPGYVPYAELSDLFASADALVLPYRGGTATYNVTLAHHFGLPVLATTASSLAEHVRDQIDGLLCPPDDVPALAKIIKQFYATGTAQRLQKNVPEPHTDRDWQLYIAKLLQNTR
jgi:glycosyltransferase involved in cell wall biosynthesis